MEGGAAHQLRLRVVRAARRLEGGVRAPAEPHHAEAIHISIREELPDDLHMRAHLWMCVEMIVS